MYNAKNDFSINQTKHNDLNHYLKHIHTLSSQLIMNWRR